MTPVPAQLRQMARASADEDYRFRAFLKHHPRLSSKEIDRVVHEITERVWRNTDCTACGNCCKEVVPTLSQPEVERLASRLAMSSSEFASQYLKPAEPAADNPWVMREPPCPFLKDNRCRVYEDRPANCRDYPYLDKANFTSRTFSMIGRLSECSAVVQVWQELKQSTGFRHRAR
jgi:uncharacterized protein